MVRGCAEVVRTSAAVPTPEESAALSHRRGLGLKTTASAREQRRGGRSVRSLARDLVGELI